jgi:hypothetical protein
MTSRKPAPAAISLAMAFRNGSRYVATNSRLQATSSANRATTRTLHASRNFLVQWLKSFQVKVVRPL